MCFSSHFYTSSNMNSFPLARGAAGQAGHQEGGGEKDRKVQTKPCSPLVDTLTAAQLQQRS